MAATISPNVQTQTPLSGGTPIDSSATAPVTSTTAAVDTYTAALHQIFLGAPATDIGPLGLRTPQNPEDAALLLEEAQIALDRTTINSSNASVQSRLGAARQSLGGTAAAIADASTAFQTATSRKATDAASLATATTTRTTLTATVATLDTIDRLNAEIAAAQASGDTASAGNLASQRDAAVAGLGSPPPSRADVASQLAATAATIAGLDTALTDDDTAITAAAQVLAQAANRLASVFSQLALATQTANGPVQLIEANSTQRDIGFDNVTATIDRARADDVSRAKADAATADVRRRESEASRDPAQLAAALGAGLGEALAVLRQEAAAPPPPSSLQALVRQDNRIRLSL